MPEFFLLPEWIRVTAGVLPALLVIAQSAAFIYSLYQCSTGHAQRLDALVEAASLGYALLLVFFAAQIRPGAEAGDTFFDVVRVLEYILFACSAVVAAAGLLDHGSIFSFAVIPLEALTLPFVEENFPNAFPALFLLSSALLLLRAVIQIVRFYRDTREKLSSVSMKYAIDALHTGILFCRPDGRIILINEKMQELMVTLTGSIVRSERRFFAELLSRGKCREGCEKLDIGEQIAYRLPDESVWLFNRVELLSGRRTLVELSATDITDQWKMTAELRDQHRALQSRQDELNRAIADIRSLCREEESMRIRSRFHDILGQRIALLLRNLRENREPDEELLRAFTEGLSQELKESRSVNSPQKRIETLRRMMSGIGVTIHLQGELPDDRLIADLCADIITEAATNSVRHGFASEVLVQAERAQGDFLLRISDNGIPPSGRITEGGGISGMRRKLGLIDGTLGILTVPQFILSISIPGGSKS